MSTYKVNVNGVSYDVEVIPAGGAVVNPAEEAISHEMDAQPVANSGAAGSIEVTCDVAGKIFKIVAAPGDNVTAGDALVILEAMKMEIPVVAPQDGTVASIDVAVGDTIEAGACLATLN